jgi:hypothetical protein
MTAELSQFDLIALIISSIAVIMSIVAFIIARQHAIIESFISIVNAFFTEDTRKARRALRNNKILTNLIDEEEDDPKILVEKGVFTVLNDLSEDDKNYIWEMVSAYNRLGFVLQHYPKIFLYQSLKDRFLEWDSETVIEMWKLVRLYVYKERYEKQGRGNVGRQFQCLFNEANKY